MRLLNVKYAGFLFLLSFYSWDCFGQNNSIANLLDTIDPQFSESVEDTRVEYCSSFSFEVLACNNLSHKEKDGSVNNYTLYWSKNKLIKIDWKIEEEKTSIILYPQYLENHVVFKSYLYNDGAFIREISGYLILYKKTGQLFFIDFDFLNNAPAPPNNKHTVSKDNVNDIYVLNQELKPSLSYKIYDQIIVSQSEYIYDRYLIEEDFCLLKQSFVRKKSLRLDEITLTNLGKHINTDHCFLQKTKIHQCSPNLPFWIFY